MELVVDIASPRPLYGRGTARVLAWALGRVEGSASAVESPVGLLPADDALPLDGLDLPAADLAELFAIDPESWLTEVELTREWFERFADALPAELSRELETLRENLEAAAG